MNYVIVVIILMIIYNGSDIRVSGQLPAVPGGASDLVGSRMTLACGAQPSFQAAKIFDDCLSDRGLDYRFLDVCKPCGKIAGLDMSTYKGVWEFACLAQGSNRDKTRDCIVEQMQKQVPKMSVMDLSVKAMEKCKECVEKLTKQNAKNGGDPGTKKKGNDAKKKAQEEAKKKKGGGGEGGDNGKGGGDGGKGGGDGGKGGGDGGKGGGDGGKGGGGDGGSGGYRRRKGGIFGGRRRSRTTAKPGSEQQTQQQKKSKQQQMNKAPARKTKTKE